ncbi:hypothetical protein Tco_1534287, partial [Tanacetum coccineum]
MSDNIPFEIQMEIIKKVSDVNSLIQFRSSEIYGCYLEPFNPKIIWSSEIYGFWVCLVTKDPTVVKIKCRIGMLWHVEVFTLSSGGLECDSK